MTKFVKKKLRFLRICPQIKPWSAKGKRKTQIATFAEGPQV
jgi:hypothetical protein